MSAIYLLPGRLTYWPRKYTTRVDPHVDNSCQVWSWYDHTLPSYSVFVCWHVTWPCELDLWSFDLEHMSSMASHRSNTATKYEDPRLIRSWVMSYNVSRWLPLKMRTLHNFGGSTMKVIKVICENNARPCVKRRRSFCACAKLRDLLKVPEMSYCSRYCRRRSTVLDFKSWAHSLIYGHFQQHLYCACAQTVICELLVKI